MITIVVYQQTIKDFRITFSPTVMWNVKNISHAHVDAIDKNTMFNAFTFQNISDVVIII